MSQLQLAGKTALVTGSTSGIGLGIAIALAKEGANIVMNGFGDVAGPQAKIEACKVKVAHHPADMSKVVEIEDMMEFAKTQFGGVDILVNNAGIQHVAAIENFPVERWDAIIAINLSSAFHTSRLAIPYMQRKMGTHHQSCLGTRFGRIRSEIRLCGRQTRHCGINKSNSLRKRNLWADLQCDLPWLGSHPLVQKQVDAKAAELKISNEEATKLLLGEKEPSMQFTTPEELGALAVFLCSKAADNVRGVAWNMDGGWTAQ
jgi:3-hydroxybutyrate dehydrogenase